jgi:peptide/nickel transport system ATP-binding protein
LSDPILSVRDLSVFFRGEGAWRPAVAKISFDVGPRETLAVVGESGSGKSVTALAVMGLLPTANSRIEGAVRLDGRDISGLSDTRMREVRGDALTMIFQEPMTSLNPVLTIGFQIAETLIYHRGLGRKAADREALRILERVQVPAARQRLGEYPHRFSGGMRQRVMIAMALACKPKLLIADEPTTALDVTVQAQILELIKQLQDEEGMSVVFITHDMGVVAEIADRVAVMWRGEKVEEGSAEQVLLRPRHAYTRALLAAVPRLGSMKGESAPRPFAVPEAIDAAPRPPNVGPALEDKPILEVTHLVTRFPIRAGVFGRLTGRVHAVEDVSFFVGTGETASRRAERRPNIVRGTRCSRPRSRGPAQDAPAHADDFSGPVRQPQSANERRRGDRRADRRARPRVAERGTRSRRRAVAPSRPEPRNGEPSAA